MLSRILGTTALATLLAAGASQADTVLHILHINDLHSRIQPINAFDSTCSAEDDAAGECFGGIARVETAIEQMRAELAGENVIVLDAGDQFQGSLFYTTYKGEAAAEFMNLIDFDVMAVGNHEFDDGPENLIAFGEMLDVPIVSGNLDLSQNEELRGHVEDHLILDVNGIQVGIVSAVATDTNETSSPGPTVIFQDEIDAIQNDVDTLTEMGVDIIIGLTHVGVSVDRQIAANVTGLDAIVGGHSHTYFSASDPEATETYPVMVTNPDGVEVPIVQAYAYSKYLGHLTLEIDENGVVTAASGDTMLLDASVEPDPDIAARVAELIGPIEESMSEVVAETAAPIEGSREVCRAEVCEMGVLVAEAMLERVADQGIQIAIQNGGGLRASIDEGPVTMGEVFTVLPFQNTLATFQLNGASIVEALENGVSQVEEGAGRFPQVAGLRYTWDPEAEPGSRIVSVEVEMDGEWQAIDPEMTYGVVSNNYMRGGGDGYTTFVDAQNAYDYGPGLEQVVADYLADNTPYEPYTDDRIMIAE